MKKYILVIAFAWIVVMQVNAQQINTTPQTSANVGLTPVKQGNWLVGGSIGNIGYSFEGDAFNININPRAGYFIANGLALGAEVLGGLTAVKDQDNQWSYAVAPFLRYYFPEGASTTGRFFAHGNVGIAGGSAGDGVSPYFGANVGYAHFITQTVALEGTVGYNYSKANANLGNLQNGIGLAIGFQIYLPGRK